MQRPSLQGAAHGLDEVAAIVAALVALPSAKSQIFNSVPPEGLARFFPSCEAK